MIKFSQSLYEIPASRANKSSSNIFTKAAEPWSSPTSLTVGSQRSDTRHQYIIVMLRQTNKYIASLSFGTWWRLPCEPNEISVRREFETGFELLYEHTILIIRRNISTQNGVAWKMTIRMRKMCSWIAQNAHSLPSAMLLLIFHSSVAKSFNPLEIFGLLRIPITRKFYDSRGSLFVVSPRGWIQIMVF